jgi:hypothetical protein
MRVSRKDFSWAVSEGVISEVQAEDLWHALERLDVDRPRFDLPHVAYYLGALVVISAMTWFMTRAGRGSVVGDTRDLTLLRACFHGRWQLVVA